VHNRRAQSGEVGAIGVRVQYLVDHMEDEEGLEIATDGESVPVTAMKWDHARICQLVVGDVLTNFILIVF